MGVVSLSALLEKIRPGNEARVGGLQLPRLAPTSPTPLLWEKSYEEIVNENKSISS